MQKDKESMMELEQRLKELIEFLLLQAERTGNYSHFLALSQILHDSKYLSQSYIENLYLGIGKKELNFAKFMDYATIPSMPEPHGLLGSMAQPIKIDLERFRFFINTL